MLSFPKDDDNYMGASDGEHEQLIKIYHDDDDALPTADSEQQPEGLGDGCVGNWINAHKFACNERLSVRIDLDWK